MSDQDGGDRPRWEGFPGGVDPAQEPTGPVEGLPLVPPAPEPQPVAPQFPVQPMADETAPVPVVGTAPIDTSGSGLGPRSARRQAVPRRDTSRYVAFACAAAVVLVGIGFAFVACNNDDVTPAGSAPVVPLTGTSTTPSPTNTLPTSSAIVTNSPTPTSSTAKATPTGSSTASPSASASATATKVAAAKQPVVVLNSTGITGLAKRVAADIESGGWTVTKTTNWTGKQPTVSTIYYLPGAKNKASAELFAKKFDVARSVKPALPGMTSNLTLVLTRDAA